MVANIRKSVVALFLISFTYVATAQNTVNVSSPDGKIKYHFSLTDESPTYRIQYNGARLIKRSSLGLKFEDYRFKRNLQMLDPIINKVDDTYELVVGKTKTARDHHNELIIPLFDPSSERKINFVVRVFNDGVAFCYMLPKQEKWSSYKLLDEETSFNISGNPTVKTLLWDDYENSHEGFYHTLLYNQLPTETLMDMPSLFQFNSKAFVALTEARLRNFAGMYLVKKNDVLNSQLTPLPDQSDIKVEATLPHRTPWRVIMISNDAGKLLESNILTSLNDPPLKRNWSWIKPGKTTFHWWNGDIVPDTSFAPGVNFKTNKYYIDFASKNNIEYHSVIGYGGFPWYKSDGASYSSYGPNTDVTKTVESLDMKKVVNYAQQQNVGIHVWVNWKAIYPDLETVFSKFQKWGIKGMMVDFMNRNDQEMIQIQEKILQKAAEHQLFIQFHGANKPTGLHRTYPNEFTREGALNYEHNKWRSVGLSADHDVNIVFTRLIAGPTDYHLGGFRAVPEDEFKTHYTRPLMINTRAHMLAMYVVLETYLNMVADYPESYKNQKGFDLITKIPSSWDETVVPSAKVDEYIAVARRKGDTWYLGILNNSTARNIELSLNFLPRGSYSAWIYKDADDSIQNPNHLLLEEKILKSNSVLTVGLAKGGGQVIKLMRN